MPTPNKWSQPKRFDVASLLVPGRNVVAIEAANTAPGPAGLIVQAVVQLADGQQVVLTSGDQWKCNEKKEKNWEQVAFDDAKWQKAYLVAPYGSAPWGNFARNLEALPAEKPKLGEGPSLEKRLVAASVSLPQQLLKEVTPPEDYPWPEGIVYLGDDCSLYRGQYPGTSHDTLSVTVFTTRNSRSYPEHDLPTPIKMGRKLYALKPARPGTQPRLLVDAGRGGIGSPSVSFDGQWIYVAMAKDEEPFFHIYRIPAAGGQPQRLTDGPFHDIDPAELPDGRIVFTSTRIGTYEEYHNPPSRALFTMNPDGTGIRPITNTFIFDNEAEVLADGRILFIRSDNFFDRGKVETLLHAVHPDGTEGYTEFGLDIGPDYGGRLRAFYCGSPAPMPDGQVAFVSGPGITVGRPGSRTQRHYADARRRRGRTARRPTPGDRGPRGHAGGGRRQAEADPAGRGLREDHRLRSAGPGRGGRGALRVARLAPALAGLPRRPHPAAGHSPEGRASPSWTTRRPPECSSARTPASPRTRPPAGSTCGRSGCWRARA